MGDFNSDHPDWRYDTPNNDSDTLLEWASCSDLVLVYDPKQRNTFCWERHFSPDLCWVSYSGGGPLPAGREVLDDFPCSQHRPSLVHVGLTLPVIRAKNDGTLGRRTVTNSIFY